MNGFSRREFLRISALAAAGVTAVACAKTPQQTAPPQEEAAATPCAPTPIIVPTRPAETPKSGLHITGRAQQLDLESYRLDVTGRVQQSLSLTYDDLRCMPKVEMYSDLVCPGFFEDKGTWAGVPIEQVLARAGIEPDAVGIRLISADGYGSLATLDMLKSQGAFLAYEWEGEPLPILHGFPARAVFPESAGSVWVKWLVRIEVLGEDYSPIPGPADEQGEFGLP
jgi:DMSO/TMAO reductase YedYZ molybdopterin-dependent catalytic subunit